MNFIKALDRSYLIAEIGVNHNGSIEKAKQLVVAAKQSGADAVKFQTFTAKNLAMQHTEKVAYQKKTTLSSETHYEMLKKLELSKDDHQVIFDFCSELKIDFISTPYDVESAKFLSDLGVSVFKTASADITDIILHNYLSTTNKPVLIATGMSDILDIKQAIKYYKKENLVLMHCVSNYPCSYESINMLALSLLQEEFDLPVGFSDHSIGYTAAIVAIAMGAKVIEKHFTLNKNDDGPDHLASSNPKEFKDLADNVRLAEMILGKKIKVIQEEEIEMSLISRKSIYYARDISIGEVLTVYDFVLRRPGDGLLPSHLEKFIGRKAAKNLKVNSKASFQDLE